MFNSALDQFIIQFDQGLRTVFGQPLGTKRSNPAAKYLETELSPTEKRHIIALMRINHAGEVSAQALYQGQAITARNPELRQTMQRSAQEENDHLIWCQQRLQELGGNTSLLNPFWYAGSLLIGATAGAVGDKYSLGFLAETERQVVKHLEQHLAQLPTQEQKAHAILVQMKQDEAHHALVAIQAGAANLPAPVTWLMGAMSKVMTKTAYWI
jgi:3-demethoxyubiquinol 3-hydroxylase